ncbi:hypothetical protein BDB01DRAFT_839098 [Pilobolus umbonatus]|nr:hypothetical protein BDB01DRAFT_839098 [Pilobolus umbonatus]
MITPLVLLYKSLGIPLLSFIVYQGNVFLEAGKYAKCFPEDIESVNQSYNRNRLYGCIQYKWPGAYHQKIASLCAFINTLQISFRIIFRVWSRNIKLLSSSLGKFLCRVTTSPLIVLNSRLAFLIFKPVENMKGIESVPTVDYSEEGSQRGHGVVYPVLYPGNREAAKYTLTIDIGDIFHPDEFTRNSRTPFDFRDGLKHCTNLKELVLSGTSSMIKAMMDTRMSELKELGAINFFNDHDCTGIQLLKLYYQHRSSLVELNLKELDQIPKTYTIPKFVSYLSSFSCLEYLHIELTSSSSRINPPFAEIINACPTLKKMVCRFYSLKSPVSTKKHVSLRELELILTVLTSNDILYIKETFPHMIKLNLEFESDGQDDSGLIKSIMSMKTLEDMRFKLHQSHNMKALRTFCRYEDFNTYIHNKASMLVLHERLYMLLCFTKCPKTGVHYMTSRLAMNTLDKPDMPSQYYDYLQIVGHSLTDLRTWFSECPMRFKIDDIIELCPSLEHLNLVHLSIFPRYLPTLSHHNITSLTLEGCWFKLEKETHVQQIFAQFAVAFPNLKRLNVIDPVFEANNNFVQPPLYQLPETGLTYLSLSIDEICNTVVDFIIAKEAEGCVVKAWYFNLLKQKVFVCEDNNALDLLEHVNKDTLIFKSSTLEEVEIDFDIISHIFQEKDPELPI